MFTQFIGGFGSRNYSDKKEKFENAEVTEVTEEELKDICDEHGIDVVHAKFATGLGASVEIGGKFYKVKKEE